MKAIEVLKSRLSSNNTMIVQNENGDIGEAEFQWKSGIGNSEILSFEETIGFHLPQSYREFLTYSNGATLFRDRKYGQWGCVLLSIDEMKTTTERLRQYGLSIPPYWIAFAKWIGDCDVLVFDLERVQKARSPYILDGDTAYPTNEWEYIKGDFSAWLDRLIVAQGAKYWRWY